MKLSVSILLTAVAALLASGGALAQEKVLGERDLNQQSLIEALTPAAKAADPAPADAAASGAEGEQPMRMRSFRPAVRPAAAAAAGTASTSAQQGRASILVTFVTDSADLTPRARSALDVLAGAMKSDQLANVRFVIEGHADPRGNADHNQRLSQARAESVRAYLVAQHSLPSDRISAVGKGSTALMNPSDPAAPENRRVTIVAQP